MPYSLRMLSDKFRLLGISEREEKVYLALVPLRAASASLIAKRTRLPRPTVYLTLNALSQKGLVSVDAGKGTAHFIANKPTAFPRIVDLEREQLAEKEVAAETLSSQIAALMRSRQEIIPQIQVFEGRANLETMLFENLPQWRESMRAVGEMTLWGYQDNQVVERYSKWHSHLWKTMEADEQIRLFSNSSNYEAQLQHKIVGREVRELPEQNHFSSSIWLYGDYVVMGMTAERPDFAIQVRDSLIASNLRAIFQLLWSAKF